jgi:hypothetical protein
MDVSYDTAHTSLAHYLASFIEKVKFWNGVIEYLHENKSVPFYDISAFFHPDKFLTA